MTKNHILAGVAALALSAGTFAAVQDATNQQQGQADHKARHEQMMQQHEEKVAQELGLNDQQKQQFDTIMKANMEKMRALREQQEAQMKQLHESALNDLSKVLTPEQMTKFKSMHERMMGPGGMRKRHHGPGGPDGPPPPPKE